MKTRSISTKAIKDTTGKITNEMQAKRAEGKGKGRGNVQPSAPVIPSEEQQVNTIQPYATAMNEAWKSLRDTMAMKYKDGFSAWCKLMSIVDWDKPRYATVTADLVTSYTKLLRPLLCKEAGWSESTCKTRCSEFRKESGLPMTENKSKGGQASKASRKARKGDVISITLNSVAYSCKLSEDMPEADMEESLFNLLNRLSKKYGKALQEVAETILSNSRKQKAA